MVNLFAAQAQGILGLVHTGIMSASLLWNVTEGTVNIHSLVISAAGSVRRLLSNALVAAWLDGPKQTSDYNKTEQ